MKGSEDNLISARPYKYQHALEIGSIQTKENIKRNVGQLFLAKSGCPTHILCIFVSYTENNTSSYGNSLEILSVFAGTFNLHVYLRNSED